MQGQEVSWQKPATAVDSYKTQHQVVPANHTPPGQDSNHSNASHAANPKARKSTAAAPLEWSPFTKKSDNLKHNKACITPHLFVTNSGTPPPISTPKPGVAFQQQHQHQQCKAIPKSPQKKTHTQLVVGSTPPPRPNTHPQITAQCCAEHSQVGPCHYKWQQPPLL